MVRQHRIDSLFDSFGHLDVRSLIAANFARFSGIKMILASFAFDRFTATRELYSFL